MKDQVGDEHGYGTYQYPTNIAFKPYKGLFDITEFKVWAGKPGEVYFDTTFANNTNPWMAPEGFIHQNLRIMIDSIPGQGSTDLPYHGAYVRFNPKYAWDICLRIAGWGNSQLITPGDGKWRFNPLKAEMLPDNRTIRATIPESLIGKPARNWHYYVMVSSYDGFGEDFFRKVMKNRGEWVIGGGTDQTIEPQVMDILAPGDSQIKQLKSFDPVTGKLAMLEPVGADLGTLNIGPWLLNLLGLILILAIGYFGYRMIKKGSKISWFWVKGKKDEETGKGA
jgi:carbohydrate-binding DOMON domain-containing protein